MSTGYTCKVETGEIKELKDYLLLCARGFGAMIHMRDDSLDKTIQPMEASDYHLKALNRAKEEYDKFLKTTDEDIQKIIDENYERNLKDKQEGLIKFDEQNKNYLSMLEKVKEWEIPTNEHKKLKEFAIEQLEMSIGSDSFREYYTQITQKDTVEGYKSWKLNDLLKDIERHSREYREECKRVSECNKWVTDLVNSLHE